MLSLRRGTVTAVTERLEGLVRLEVNGRPCVAYPGLTGPVALGDEVITNVQAVELGLGSGGFDVLYANLTRGLEGTPDPGAHVMKLPYTPLQHAVRHAEEDADLPHDLGGMPVICCSIHSQVAPACAALQGLRVAYLQLPGGALPVALSDAIRALRKKGLLELAIGVGACFGGDSDCVNVYSALAVARERRVDAAVCAIGPGIVGTGTRFGHGGMAAGIAVDAVLNLRGKPILALRLSEGDARERHLGVSHHSETILSVFSGSYAIAWPQGYATEHPIAEGADEVDVTGWEEACAGLPLSHMGRGPKDDPAFFAAAFAAGRLARSLLA